MTHTNVKLFITSMFWIALGFATSLSLVHKLTPDFAPKDPADITRAKSGLQMTSPGEAQLVAIGTSHLFRGFDPAQFEKTTGLGAYNLSFNGMSAPEMVHMVDYVADLAKSKKIKHVILEGRGFSLPSDNNLSAVRTVHASRMQDWDKYKTIEFSQSDAKYWKPRIQAVFGVSRFQSYEFDGQTDNYVAIIENAENRRRALKEDGIILQGSSPLKKTVRAARKDLDVVKNKGFGFQTGQIKQTATREEMRDKYEKLSNWENTSKLSKAEFAHYQEMINRLKEAGVKTHIVLPPTISPEWMRTHDKFVSSKLKVPLYDLRIHKQAELFSDLGLWADHGHLNGNGAIIFTELLGSNFLKKTAPKKPDEFLISANLISTEIKPECVEYKP